jgi:hypothetical protein
VGNPITHCSHSTFYVPNDPPPPPRGGGSAVKGISPEERTPEHEVGHFCFEGKSRLCCVEQQLYSIHPHSRGKCQLPSPSVIHSLTNPFPITLGELTTSSVIISMGSMGTCMYF